MLEGGLKVSRCCGTSREAGVSILGMLEGVLKGQYPAGIGRPAAVSILGMLEGVLKDAFKDITSFSQLCFNPWYVGGGVKSLSFARSRSAPTSFNPWYVGGGVKRNRPAKGNA